MLSVSTLTRSCQWSMKKLAVQSTQKRNIHSRCSFWNSQQTWEHTSVSSPRDNLQTIKKENGGACFHSISKSYFKRVIWDFKSNTRWTKVLFVFKGHNKYYKLCIWHGWHISRVVSYFHALLGLSWTARFTYGNRNAFKYCKYMCSKNAGNFYIALQLLTTLQQ